MSILKLIKKQLDILFISLNQIRFNLLLKLIYLCTLIVIQSTTLLTSHILTMIHILFLLFLLILLQCSILPFTLHPHKSIMQSFKPTPQKVNSLIIRNTNRIYFIIQMTTNMMQSSYIIIQMKEKSN
jgi:hypothetical protein